MKLSSRCHQRGAALLNLMLLLVLAALVTGGWFGWRMLEQQQHTNARLEAAVTDLGAQQETLEKQLDEAASQRRARLDTLENQLAANSDTLQEMATGGQQSWLLNEAQALASLAGERLLLTADVAAARRLLKAADETLARSGDPDVLPARRALARDIEALEAASQVDVPALVLRLGALSEAIPQAVSAGAAAQQAAFEARQPASSDSWFDGLWKRLPIAIQRGEGVAMPLDDGQARLVRLHMETLLLQAQLALLQGRPAVYEKAISQALSLLDSWYPSGHAGVAALRTALNELSEAPVQQALPDIGAGLKAIRNLQAAEAS